MYNNPSVPPTPVYGPNVPVQPVYGGQPVYQDTTPLSAWAYVGYMVLFAIPLVGFIMMLVFAFGDGNINRKNFTRGYLILGLIGFVIGFIMVLAFGASINELFSEYL